MLGVFLHTPMIVQAGNGGDGTNWVTIGMAAAAIITAIANVWMSRRKYRRTDERARNATATELGTKMADQAFRSMAAQIRDLRKEQEAFAKERDQLYKKVDGLTQQLSLTNTYLRILVRIVDANGLDRPEPPEGLDFI